MNINLLSVSPPVPGLKTGIESQNQNLESGGLSRTFEEELRSQERSLDTATEVKVVGISQDNRAPILRYEPGHPDANAEGYVAMPNVNVMEEMVSLMEASRSYEANTAAFNATKNMAQSALDLGRNV